MLPKINRIKKKKDFEEIFKKGASFKNSLLILRVLENNLDSSRFAFIVSLKVSKSAVKRNKVRRRLSEIIRANFLEIKNGIDVVLISIPGIEKKDFPEIKEAVEKLLVKAKLKTNV